MCRYVGVVRQYLLGLLLFPHDRLDFKNVLSCHSIWWYATPSCLPKRFDENGIVHSGSCEPAHCRHVALGLRLGVAISSNSRHAPGLADSRRARPKDHRYFYACRSSVHTEILMGSIDGSSGPSLAGAPARMDVGDAD